MRMLWILIKKDICFCSTWLLLAVILILLMPVYIIRSIEIVSAFYEPVLILCAICASNLVVSRICYIEDDRAVKTFLGSLPVTQKELIVARFLYAAGMTVIFILLAECLGLLMDGSVTAIILLAGMGIGLGYESVYLFLYYKFGNQAAQYAVVACIAVAAVIWRLF